MIINKMNNSENTATKNTQSIWYVCLHHVLKRSQITNFQDPPSLPKLAPQLSYIEIIRMSS